MESVKTYHVPMTLQVRQDLVVRARGAIEACEVAREAWKRLPVREVQVDVADSPLCMSIGFATAPECSDDLRLSVYSCEHCGEQSLKEDWGPGRVVCPACGKTAPSPAELGERVAAEVSGQQRLLDDLRSIGVVVEACSGCGKIDCGGCPAGTFTTIDKKALTPEIAAKLGVLWEKQRREREGQRSTG